MSITPELRTQLQAALVDAFPTLEDLDQLVQDALHISRVRITTANGLEAIVGDLLDHCGAGGNVAALACAAYNRQPSNSLLSRLVAQASAWPELSTAGLALIDGAAYVCASRQAELVYLGALIERLRSGQRSTRRWPASPRCGLRQPAGRGWICPCSSCPPASRSWKSTSACSAR